MTVPIQCPSCEHEFTYVPVKYPEPEKPFIELDRLFDQMHLRDALATEPIQKRNRIAFSTRKLYYLLQLLDGELPELDQLPCLPSLISDYIDHASIETLKHIIIQSVGRWDCILENQTAAD